MSSTSPRTAPRGRTGRMFRLPRPTRGTVRRAGWAAVPLGMLLSALIVAQSSYAAFSATTVNPASTWAAGTVVLTDDDSNAALFTVAAGLLRPGSTGTKCIAVTSSGTVPSEVRLYATAATLAQTNGLADAMTLSVDIGTGGTFATCTGFVSSATLYSGSLSGFTSNANYGTGLVIAPAAGSWQPTGTAPETRVYRFTYALPATAPNSVQAGTAALGFTWEAQSLIP